MASLHDAPRHAETTTTLRPDGWQMYDDGLWIGIPTYAVEQARVRGKRLRAVYALDDATLRLIAAGNLTLPQDDAE